MEVATITLKINYNAPFYFDDEKKLKQVLKDIYFSGLLKNRVALDISDHIADNMIIDVEKSIPDF